MKKRAIAAAGLLLLGGLAVPASGANAAAKQVRQCYVTGDRICGPKSPAEQAEAWNNFDTAGFTAAELAKPFRVTYRGTVRQSTILADGHEWYLAPSSIRGVDHVFEIEFGVSR